MLVNSIILLSSECDAVMLHGNPLRTVCLDLMPLLRQAAGALARHRGCTVRSFIAAIFMLLGCQDEPLQICRDREELLT